MASPAGKPERPRYDELPALDGLGVRHCWGVGHPILGSISELVPERVAYAAGLVRTGERVVLSLPIDAFDPPLFGRAAAKHRAFDVDRNNREDVLDDFNPQSSSQWDGLSHVRAREHGFYGGIADAAEASDLLGIDAWGTAGIAGRGVLLDIVRWKRSTGQAWDPLSGQTVTPEDLRAIAAHQGVELRAGDILCVRTGWCGAILAAQAAGDRPPVSTWPGIDAGEATARMLWDGAFAAICSDNPAIEASPGDPAAGSLHRRLIPALGMALAELLTLDQLADTCAEASRYEFFFVSTPLAVPGGVSSPANAMAIL